MLALTTLLQGRADSRPAAGGGCSSNLEEVLHEALQPFGAQLQLAVIVIDLSQGRRQLLPIAAVVGEHVLQAKQSGASDRRLAGLRPCHTPSHSSHTFSRIVSRVAQCLFL